MQFRSLYIDIISVIFFMSTCKVWYGLLNKHNLRKWESLVAERRNNFRKRLGMDYSNLANSESMQVIKPALVEEDVLEVLKTLYGLDGGTLVLLNGYDDLNYHYIKPQNIDNPYITSICEYGYILKVINDKDSQNVQVQEAQSKLLIFLRDHDIACPCPVKNKLGHYFSQESLPLSDQKSNKRKHVVKLLEYLPGILLKDVNANFFLYYQVGVLAANINKVSKKFQHSAYETHESIWHLKSFPKVKPYTYVVENVQLREIIEEVMDDFISKVMPRMNELEKQIIHGDLNSQNILCQKNQEWSVTAVIDFGDSHMSYPLHEVAISMFYTILDCKRKELDYFVGSGHTLAGYAKTNSEYNIDYLLLKKCISARLCQSYVLGLYNSVMQPENDYISENLSLYPQLLKEITRTPTSVVKDIWKTVINSYANSF